MKDFWKLAAGKQARELNHWLHALVDSYPALARHRLAAELQQTGTEVVCYIARGCGSSDNDGAERWHCNVALGALASLDYMMFLADHLRLIPHGCAKRFVEMKVELQERLCAMLKEEQLGECAAAAPTLVQ